MKFASNHRKIRLYLLTNSNVIFTRVMRSCKNFQSSGPSIPLLQWPQDTSFSNITNGATDSFTFLYELYVRDFGGNKRALTLLRTFRRILVLWRGKLFRKVTTKKGRCNQYTSAVMGSEVFLIVSKERYDLNRK